MYIYFMASNYVLKIGVFPKQSLELNAEFHFNTMNICQYPYLSNSHYYDKNNRSKSCNSVENEQLTCG